MKTFTAKANLEQLLKYAEQGEIVYIKGADNRLFALVQTRDTSEGTPKWGIVEGLVKIADDFNDPMPEFEPSAK